MSASDFRELNVWQKARSLAVRLYRTTQSGEISRDFALRDQIRRAAVSICSNIAEGNDRASDRDTVRFMYIAKGSAAELLSHLEIAEAIGVIAATESSELKAAVEEASRMLSGLIRARTNAPQD